VSVEAPARRPQRERRRTTIRIFSSASDAPRARRPSDVFLLLGTLIAAALGTVPAPDATALDTAAANLAAAVPGLFGGVWEVAYDVLLIWPVVLLTATVVARSRLRIGRDMVVGLVATIVYLAGFAATTGTDLGAALTDWLDPAGDHAAYLGVRVAIATALIATAAPHLSQPLRRFGRWILVLGVLATVALGAGALLGTVAGVLLGLAGAATAHLLFGSPGGRLTPSEVADALADLGVQAVDLAPGPLDARGVATMLGRTPEGRPLRIKIFGRDARNGQLIASTWSSLRLRGASPKFGSGWQQVQAESLVSLYAERGGVPVMPVIAAGVAAEGDAVLVLDADGRPFDALDADAIDEATVEATWRAFRRMASIGVALGRVDAGSLVLRADGSVAVGDFSDAAMGVEGRGLDADAAQVLVVTALLVGREPAVDVAARVLGPEALERALPYLQRAAMDPAVAHEVKRRGWDLDDLRLLAEQETGSAPPDLEQLRRVTWGSILKLAILGLIAYTLVSAIADVGLSNIVDEFRSAGTTEVILALAISPFVAFPQAVSTRGATLAPVGFFPVLMLQYGIQFIALAVPSSAARVALEVRFFERVGVKAAGAVSIGVIDSVVGFAVQLTLIILITVSGLASLHLFGSGGSSSGSGSGQAIDWRAIVIGVVLLLLAVGVALAIPRVRRFGRRFLDGLRQGAADGRDALRVLRHPRKLGALLAGNLGTQVLQAIILGVCLAAFGRSASFAELILVNTFVCLFAGFMPVPGGVGVFEAAMTAGLIAIGVPQAAAASTALLYRLVTFYIPPAWGGFAMKWMRANRYL